MHGRAEHLGEGDDGRDGVGPGRLVPDDDGHPADARLDQQVGELVEAATDGAAFQARRRRHVRLALLGERRHPQRTNTGPGGGLAASWKARRITMPSSSIVADLVGPLRTVRQADQVTRQEGVGARCRWSCWPAVTTIGDRLARALVRFPMALPRPGAVCTLTKAGRRVACA